MRNPALRALALSIAALLGACGGDITGQAAPAAVSVPTSPADADPAAPPEAPGGFTLTPARALHFSWTAAAGATGYRLLEDPDGASGEQLVSTLPAGATEHDLPVLPPLRLGARYRLQACNAAGCSETRPVSVPEGLARAVDYLKASNTGAFDQFGLSLALSADGEVLAVGAPREDSAATGVDGPQADNSSRDSGAVYMFARSGGVWRQQAYLKASHPGTTDLFGSQLALSADGLTLAVGAPAESSVATGIGGNEADDSRGNSGAVYVFTRSSGSWQQQAYVKASNTDAGDLFGSTLTLSADGSTLAVTALGEDSAATGVGGDQTDNSLSRSGAVYVFQRTLGAWRQQAYLKASQPDEDDVFGSSLALSADGDTLAVGALGEDSAATGVNGDQSDNSHFGSGAAYVFTRLGGRWQQQAYLKASNSGVSDRFGYSLTLSADGHTLAVGAPTESSAATGVNGPQHDDSAARSGAVYVFTRGGALWQQQAYLKAAVTAADDQFGTSLSLSADGQLLAVGAPLEDGAALGLNGDATDKRRSNSGAAYLFERLAGGWRQRAYLKAPRSDAGDNFGSRLALSGDGHTLVVGALYEDSAGTGANGSQDDNTASDSGAVYLY